MRTVLRRIVDSSPQTSYARRQALARLTHSGINRLLRRPWTPQHPLVKVQLCICVPLFSEKSPTLCPRCQQPLLGQRNARDRHHIALTPGWAPGKCMGCGYHKH